MSVWRRVDNQAVLCDGCKCNEECALYADGSQCGREMVCTAKDNICVRLDKTIQNDKKAYSDFRDIFRDPEWPFEEEAEA